MTSSELFFADRSNFMGAIDLRTGKLLHSYGNTTASAHHLLCLPSDPSTSHSNSSLPIGLTSISSDATLRLHSNLPSLDIGGKGNRVVEGKKPSVVGMVGGVGIGSFVWRGHGQVEEDEVVVKGDQGKDVDGEDGSGEDDEDEDDRGVWEGMSEVEDEDEGSDSEEEDGESAKVTKKAKR